MFDGCWAWQTLFDVWMCLSNCIHDLGPRAVRTHLGLSFLSPRRFRSTLHRCSQSCLSCITAKTEPFATACTLTAARNSWSLKAVLSWRFSLKCPVCSAVRSQARTSQIMSNVSAQNSFFPPPHSRTTLSTTPIAQMQKNVDDARTCALNWFVIPLVPRSIAILCVLLWSSHRRSPSPYDLPHRWNECSDQWLGMGWVILVVYTYWACVLTNVKKVNPVVWGNDWQYRVRC